MIRRAFLKAIAAAPVAAKDAAASMGLSAPVTGLGWGNPNAISGGGAIPDHPSDPSTWIKRALKRMESKRGKAELESEARYAARTLDSDLASMRSVSPAWAYGRQVERCRVDLETRRKAQLLDELAEAMKGNFF